MRCLRAIRGVAKADKLQNIKIREDTFTPESITDVIRHRRRRWFGRVCCMQRENIVRQVYKQDFKGQQKRGRPLKRWSDQIRNDTRLPLLTAEWHAINRRTARGHYGLLTAEWHAINRRTARGHYGLLTAEWHAINRRTARGHYGLLTAEWHAINRRTARGHYGLCK